MVKSERRTSSLSPPLMPLPPTSLTDTSAPMMPRMASLAMDRKQPLLKFSVSAILAKKGARGGAGDDDEGDCASVKEEARVKEEDAGGGDDDIKKPFNDAKPLIYGKKQRFDTDGVVVGRIQNDLM